MTRRTPFALTLLSTLLLAACGGGGGGSDDDTATTERESRAFASLGYYVPEGQAQLVVNLSNCTESDLNANTSTPVTSATLTLSETGEVVFRGAVGSATSASELVRIGATEDAERQISFEATNRANNAGVTVRYDLEAGTASASVNAYTSTAASGELEARVGSSYFECTLPANAFSLPTSMTAARLARFTAGATGADDDGLNGEASLIATSTSAIWDGSFGTPWDPLHSSNSQYAGSRHARLDWSGSTTTLSASDRRNGTFTTRALPPSGPDAREYTASYQEFYSNIGRFAGTPFSTLSAQVNYPADPAASYDIRVRRNGTVIQPQRTLNSSNFTYTSTRSRFGGGDLNGIPNAFYANSNAPIALSNCQRGSQSVQRRIVFLPDQRIIWLDGDNNELTRFTPDDSAYQRRQFALSGGTSTTLRATFKVYADGVAQIQDMPNQVLDIGNTAGLIEVRYQENGSNVIEFCAAPTLQPNPELTLNSRITSVLDFGGSATLTTNTSSFTCPGDSGPTSWRHRINTSGQLETETTLPGNTPAGFQGWAGATNWVGQANAQYEEDYWVSAGSVSQATAGFFHPATTVSQNCRSSLRISGDANAPGGMTLVSVP